MSELRRVLLVDDDEDIRAIVQIAMESLGGLEVQTCATAEEALATIPTFAPDLVLLDVEMPGTDGLKTLAATRSDPQMAAVPVIFLTARASEEEKDRYRSLGARGVIAKPFDPLHLPRRLQELWAELTNGAASGR